MALEAQVVQDAHDQLPPRDRRDPTTSRAADGALHDIQTEDALHELGEGAAIPRTRAIRAATTASGDPRRNDVIAPARARCQDPVGSESAFKALKPSECILQPDRKPRGEPG